MRLRAVPRLNQPTDLKVLGTRCVELALVHLKHRIEDYCGAGEPDPGAAHGDAYVRLHGVRRRNASVRRVSKHGDEGYAFAPQGIHGHRYLHVEESTSTTIE